MKKIRNSIIVTILLSLIISANFTSYAFAEYDAETADNVMEENALRTLSYDEFKMSLNEKQDTESVMPQPLSDERISLNEISNSSYTLDGFKAIELPNEFYDIEDEKSQDSSDNDDANEELLRTNPTPSLLIYVNN